MTDFSRSTPKNILRAVLLAIFPWIPPVLFEKTDFYFHLTHNPDWYYNLSGYRLFVDLASFAVWGIVVAYLLRLRCVVVQIVIHGILSAHGSPALHTYRYSWFFKQYYS